MASNTSFIISKSVQRSKSFVKISNYYIEAHFFKKPFMVFVSQFLTLSHMSLFLKL